MAPLKLTKMTGLMTAIPIAVPAKPALRTIRRYRATGLLTAAVFVALELGAALAGGPQSAEMSNPPGLLARYLATFLTPAPSLLRAGSDRMMLSFQLFLALKALLAIGIVGLMWWRTRPALKCAPALKQLALAAQLLAALALDSLAFHLLVAVQLGALLPLRRALACLAIQILLGIGVDMLTLSSASENLADRGVFTMMVMLSMERCLLMLGFALAWLARQELQGRMQLAASHAQLRATQSLLGDTVRASERMRIARNLHDAVGHHLTALNLHLDLASRQSGDKPATALATARELSRSLLAEVRGIVSAEREEQDINLRQALQLLCAGIPTPAIELTMDAQADACSPAAAHTLLCCVQEAVTNAVRHAGASRLVIEIRGHKDLLLAHIADNGNGSGDAPEGNGLRGMRERLAAQGGALHTGSTARQGFWLELSLPMKGAQA